ncbi:MAG: hypothetical protein JNK74_20605 [Candidatus Hydrogenedentes bacterium]|nr:hypothetical protein [Candidatus Hydrogenedentota bacterium]
MEIIIRRRDIYVVFTVLFLFVCWVAYAKFENRSMQARLRELASRHVDEWFNTESPQVKREDFEYVAIVDTERPYELFGPSYGVVHVYIREKGDKDCKTFKGIEYYYKHDGNEWELGDSAGCSAKEHHIRAFETYLEKGMGIEERVFDDALGIEFDVEKLRAHLEGRPYEGGGLHDGHDHDEPALQSVEQGAASTVSASSEGEAVPHTPTIREKQLDRMWDERQARKEARKLKQEEATEIQPDGMEAQ